MTNQRTNRRFFILGAVLLVLAGGGLGAYLLTRPKAAAPAYKTQPVSRQRIVATVTASGTISPLKTVQVGSQVSGRVLELFADFNSTVTKGQVVAKLDPTLFATDVQRANANLAASRAGLTKADAALGEARRQAARSQALVDKGVLSVADADTAQSAARMAAASRVAAAADVKTAEAALAQAKTNLEMTTILSPIDGVVISRNVDAGQTVAASLSAPTLFTIAEDMRAMEVHTSVAESDVGALAEGNQVTFTVDAFPGERFKGAVSQIRNSPTTVQNVVTYDAVVRVDNADLKLRPGMTANVTFIVAQRQDALAVSSAALRFTPAGASPAGGRRQGAARTVWVLEAGKPKAFEVQTGVTDGRNTEITGGELPEGALAIVGSVGDAGTAPAAGAAGRQQGASGGARGGQSRPRGLGL